MEAQRSTVTVIALSLMVGTAMAAPMALYVISARASGWRWQEAEALQYDDACNTSYSGLSVPFDVDAAFRRVGRVESHHLHGPVSGGFRGCTMAVAGDGDEAYLTVAETGVDPCHAGRPEPGWASEPVGDVEAIASPPCS